MIGSLRVLGLIPARGGSKGVPRKNVRDAGGKPLIAWTIEAAKASRFLDRVVLSSDNDEIISVAMKFGCDAPFKRPADLATDEADSMSVVRHALSALPEKFDLVVLLQPTSPLRRTDDIDGAISLCIDASSASCVSICEAEKSPYWMFERMDDGALTPLIKRDAFNSRRQDVPPAYALNGAVYVGHTERILAGENFFFGKTVGYCMPKERSFDIDSEFDLKIVDMILKGSAK